MLSTTTMMNRRTVNPPPYAPAYKPQLSDSQKFGKRLSELRLDRGLTQIQLAIATQRDRSYISDLERGMKSPTLDTMRLIADVFMMPISELLEGI
jgi:DNA-binding XRE family transcriptional regulator